MARRLLSLLLLGFIACSTHAVDLSVQAPATLSAEPAGYEDALVTRVVDGDTIEIEVTSVVEGPGAGEVQIGGLYDVRLLGIDTPESVKPGTLIECFGREASAAAKAFLEGESVRLVKDVEEKDRYDRLLRYVYVGSEMANARLVANGYAAAYTYPPNVRHADLFVALQSDAQETARGLWHPDTCAGRGI